MFFFSFLLLSQILHQNQFCNQGHNNKVWLHVNHVNPFTVHISAMMVKSYSIHGVGTVMSNIPSNSLKLLWSFCLPTLLTYPWIENRSFLKSLKLNPQIFLNLDRLNRIRKFPYGLLRIKLHNYNHKSNPFSHTGDPKPMHCFTMLMFYFESLTGCFILWKKLH